MHKSLDNLTSVGNATAFASGIGFLMGATTGLGATFTTIAVAGGTIFVVQACVALKDAFNKNAVQPLPEQEPEKMRFYHMSRAIEKTQGEISSWNSKAMIGAAGLLNGIPFGIGLEMSGPFILSTVACGLGLAGGFTSLVISHIGKEEAKHKLEVQENKLINLNEKLDAKLQQNPAFTP